MESPASHSKPTGFAKDAAWMFISQGGRLCLQGVYFFLLARVLGAHDLGILSGSVALINILVPFCGWGGANLMIKYVSRDRSVLREHLTAAYLALVVSAIVLGALVLLIAPLVLQENFHWVMFLLMAIAEMFVLKIVDTAAHAFQAIDRLDLTARVHFSTGIQRLVALGLFVFLTSSRSLSGFAACFLFAAIFSASYTVWMMYRYLTPIGSARCRVETIKRQVIEGFPYSLGIASKSVYGDVDKTMLASMSTASITGLYTAAYRIVTLAFVPVASVVMSSSTRLFRKGDGGVRETSRFARKLLPILLGYSVIIGGLMTLSAPLLPRMLGPSFEGSVSILQWLAWAPIVQTVHYLYGDALMGAGRQALRSFCQAGTALLNIGLNLWLIPRFSWKGAVVATYGAEGALALAMLGITFYYVFIESGSDRRNLPSAVNVGGLLA